MVFSAGTRLGSYEVTALIGQGGMGEVYRARDTKLSSHGNMNSRAHVGTLALVVFLSMLAGGSTLLAGGTGRAGDVTGSLILDVPTGVAAGTLRAFAQAQQEADVPTLASVLAAAGQYVTEFRDRLSGIVAEERYRQRASSRTQGAGRFGTSQVQRRELRSDFLLVQPEGADRLVEYRDVFEVDGRPVRDRQERLAGLFLNPSRSAQSQMDAITIESARYNIGAITRTLNTPTIALILLYPDIQPHVTFSRTTDRTPSLDLQMEEPGHSTDVWVVEFAEHGAQTLVRGPRGTFLPAKGRFWIEATSGAVVASELIVEAPDASALIDVRYVLEPDLGVRVPDEMRERYRGRAGDRAEGTATYGNFRRFLVQAEESFRD